jgi:hypothetical protein
MKNVFYIVTVFSFVLAVASFAQRRMIDVDMAVIRYAEDGSVERVKSNDEAKPGDALRVVVAPASDYYVYVVYSDHASSRLLNPDERLVEDGKKLELPGEDYYEIDDKSSLAEISVVVAAAPVEEIEAIFEGKTVVAKFDWRLAEMKIERKVKANVFTKSDKAVRQAGNVRASQEGATIETQRFTGMGAIVKKYRIDVLR